MSRTSSDNIIGGRCNEQEHAVSFGLIRWLPQNPGKEERMDATGIHHRAHAFSEN